MKTVMRFHPVVTLLIVTSAVVACDASSAGRLAGLGASQTNGGQAALVVSPGQVQLNVGGTVQLATNAPDSLQPRLQWTSTPSAIAAVSQTGLVTALGVGSATITVRYATDTTNSASAVINVTAAQPPR